MFYAWAVITRHLPMATKADVPTENGARSPGIYCSGPPVHPSASGSRAQILQVRSEEGEDASPCVSSGFLVVARSGRQYGEDRLQDGEREGSLLSSPFVVVQKGVSGLGVLLEVVLDPDSRQGLLEAIGGSSQSAVPAAVASDHGHACLRKLAV